MNKKLFFAFVFSIFADFVFAYEIRPVPDFAFTNSDCEFILRLDGVNSKSVSVSTPNFSASMNSEKYRFSSMKQEEFFDDRGRRGTLIHFWYNFSATGRILIPPIEVWIGNKKNRVPFRSIQVYENPATIRAEVFAEYGVANESGSKFVKNSNLKKITLGEKIVFTIYIKYCVQILDFKVDLPKNSIFEELERYEILKNPTARHEFSGESLPIAKFQWQPLSSGDFELPEITITATNYNGSKEICKLQPRTFSVSKKKSSASAKKAPTSDSSVKAAFEITENANEEKTDLDSESIENEKSSVNGKPIKLKKGEAIFKGGEVFAVPEKSSKTVALLEENTVVKIADETKNYYLIKTGKISGWVEKGALWTSDKF